MAETILRGLAATPQDSDGTPVRILPVDIYGDAPVTTTFDVVRGLYAAAQHNPDVISLSLGSEFESPLLRDAVGALRAQGVLVVAAAGNEPTVQPTFPAAYPEVLAVTAGDRRGGIAPYANRGEFVDLVVPGTSVVHFDNQTYIGTGTSYAAAYLSGIAVGLSAQEQATPDAVEGAVRRQFGAPQP
jgi:subtilisin family serine protease